MLRAVIFDFDGVITDSEMLHLRAFNVILAKLGAEISRDDYYTNYLGLSDIDFFKTLISEKIVGCKTTDVDKLLKEKAQVYETLARTESTIINGVLEFLEMLNANKIPMAICSGALLEEIGIILDQGRLRHFFGAIVSAEQVKKGKPDPEGFKLALQKLNTGNSRSISPKECIAVEDSHWGLEAAKAAGMHTVAVTNSYSVEELKMADKIVASLAELKMAELQGLCR